MRKLLYICLLVLLSNTIFSASTDTLKETQTEPEKVSFSNKNAVLIANQYPDYPATPGDIYNITFLVSGREKETSLDVFVDVDYNIDLSFIGSVNVKDLEYSEVQKLLKETFVTAYPGAIVNVLISYPGQFRVTLIGEVEEAEIIDANSITTLADIIEEKTTDYASLRDIEIRSENGSKNVYDLFKFQRFADKKENPYLKPNDVITIRQYSKQIEVNGAVKRPGKYQLLEDESLYDLIHIFADGFTPLANQKEIEILSIMTEQGIYSDEAKYINGEQIDLSTINLHDYDKVSIPDQIDYAPKITVRGAITTYNIEIDADTLDFEEVENSSNGKSVSNQIAVPLIKNNKISSVITNMNGKYFIPTKDMTAIELQHTIKAKFNIYSDLEHAILIRGDKRIDVNINDIMNDINSSSNIPMEDKDVLVIPFRQLQVYVAGAVNDYGAMPYIENRTAEYYIGLAGGYDNSSNLFRSYKVHDVYGNKRDKDTIIGPEDVIWVNYDHPLYYMNQYQNWVTAFIAVIGTYALVDLAVSNFGNTYETPGSGN